MGWLAEHGDRLVSKSDAAYVSRIACIRGSVCRVACQSLCAHLCHALRMVTFDY